MSKLDWEKVRIEALDNRHKSEIERKLEEEHRLFSNRAGKDSLYKCPKCNVEFTLPAYKNHFEKFHLLESWLERHDLIFFVWKVDVENINVFLIHKLAGEVDGRFLSLELPEGFQEDETVDTIAEVVNQLYKQCLSIHHKHGMLEVIKFLLTGIPEKVEKDAFFKKQQTELIVAFGYWGFAEYLRNKIQHKINLAIDKKPQKENLANLKSKRK